MNSYHNNISNLYSSVEKSSHSVLKKILKVIMLLFIVIGVVFSALNFFPMEVDANLKVKRGANVFQNGHWNCDGVGDDCDY